jgi:ABC-type Mn2+/Zn2+ transport system ATPase subunit
MKTIIAVQHLTFAYRSDQDVLRDINLALEPGLFYALLWRNGSGKSTLLKILAGALDPRQGTSRALGIDSLRLRQIVLALLSLEPSPL